MKALVVTDNLYLFRKFKELVKEIVPKELAEFDFRCSQSSTEMFKDEAGIEPLSGKIKDIYRELQTAYQLIISIHCKQLFPADLVRSVRCVNVHPGLNPYNRGWYPQVFAIINGLPHGATIHEMDEKLDHGPIICQRQVEINSWDTSRSVYERVQQAELKLLKEHLPIIISGDYKAQPPDAEGNLNMIADFRSLCQLDMDKVVTMREAINILRALTHEPYQNAWFTGEDGDKVYVGVSIKRNSRC